MRILLIGSSGQMGKLFLRLLSQNHQHEIIQFDRDDWSNIKNLMVQADCILIAVTLTETRSVIENLAPYLKPYQGLCDLSSIKLPIVEKMLEVHSGPVLGMHPIFGPNITTYQWPIIICDGRNDDFFEPLLKTLKNLGFDLINLSAQRHDELMDVIQGLNYSVLRFYIQNTSLKDQEKSLLWPIIQKFSREDPGLYDAIIHASPEREKYIEGFFEYFRDLRKNLSLPRLDSEDLDSENMHWDIDLCLLERDYISQTFIKDNSDWGLLKRCASPNFLHKLNIMFKF